MTAYRIVDPGPLPEIAFSASSMSMQVKLRELARFIEDNLAEDLLDAFLAKLADAAREMLSPEPPSPQARIANDYTSGDELVDKFEDVILDLAGTIFDDWQGMDDPFGDCLYPTDQDI